MHGHQLYFHALFPMMPTPEVANQVCHTQCLYSRIYPLGGGGGGGIRNSGGDQVKVSYIVVQVHTRTVEIVAFKAHEC